MRPPLVSLCDMGVMQIPRVILLLVCGMTILTGCVAVPIPTTETKVLKGSSIAKDQMNFITPEVTTKQEVIDHLGSPAMIWEEANLFVYKWVVRQGVWFWAMGAGYSGAFGTEDIPKHYVLLIQYDQQDRVRRFERKVGPGKPWGDFLQDWVRSSDHKPLEAQAVEGSNDK